MQINRMFEMIYLLLDRKVMTAKELAERFEVSARTIYRDIEILSAAGIPVYMRKGRGGGISILDNFILNKAVLTEKEKSDILSSLKAVEAIHFHESDSAVKKIGSLFGGDNSDWIEVDFSSWGYSGEEPLIFNEIRTAILSQKRILFDYASGKGEKTRRDVEPLKLCFKGMSRYLYAYCSLRQDFRFFKLSRIKELTVTKAHFERRISGPVFPSIQIPEGELVTLQLKISPAMAFRVYDEFDTYRQDADGSFLVETAIQKGDWLFPYIASFGGHCKVLEPVEIRELVREEIEKMRDNYL